MGDPSQPFNMDTPVIHDSTHTYCFPMGLGSVLGRVWQDGDKGHGGICGSGVDMEVVDGYDVE